MLLALGACGFVAVAAPMFNVDTPVYSVMMQSGSIVTHSFTITNVGDETRNTTSIPRRAGARRLPCRSRLWLPASWST